jgi:hypothetical protein
MAEYREQYLNLNNWDLMEQYLNRTQVPTTVLNTLSTNPQLNKDAFSKGQLVSKTWLIDTCSSLTDFRPEYIYVCGGWYGLLSAMLLDKFLPKHVTSIDLDPECKEIALAFNSYNHRQGRFTALHYDMFDVDYIAADVIINTSFEHILPENWQGLIKNYTTPLYIIQSNNYLDPEDHINCVECVDALGEQLKFKTTYFKGTLETPLYKRFMVVGSYV